MFYSDVSDMLNEHNYVIHLYLNFLFFIMYLWSSITPYGYAFQQHIQ